MVDVTLKYITRDKLYETEKPFSAEFEVDEEDDRAQRTNYILSDQRVTVHAIQSSDKFDIDVNGFCVIKASTSLRVQDALTEPEAVELAYMNELSALLYKRFPEYSRLEPMEFVASLQVDNLSEFHY